MATVLGKEPKIGLNQQSHISKQIETTIIAVRVMYMVCLLPAYYINVKYLSTKNNLSNSLIGVRAGPSSPFVIRLAQFRSK